MSQKRKLHFDGGVFICVFLLPMMAIPATRPILGVFAFLYVAVAAATYVKEGKKAKKSPAELRQERIRELEQDLGFDPLNLHEIHPVFEEKDRDG